MQRFKKIEGCEISCNCTPSTELLNFEMQTERRSVTRSSEIFQGDCGVNECGMGVDNSSALSFRVDWFKTNPP
jgi:hypothetical protein